MRAYAMIRLISFLVALMAATAVNAANCPVLEGPQPKARRGVPVKEPQKVRAVIIEWSIKRGRECEFLTYWATQASIKDRNGLIAEFLSEPEARAWSAADDCAECVRYRNVAFWRDGDAFEQQIGQFIRLDRPPLDFEAAPRRRIMLAPQLWRLGETGLPLRDPRGVK